MKSRARHTRMSVTFVRAGGVRGHGAQTPGDPQRGETAGRGGPDGLNIGAGGHDRQRARNHRHRFIVVYVSSKSGESIFRPWWFVSFGPWFTRFTAAAAVLMPVFLVSHLLLAKTRDPTYTSLTVLLAVMAVVWPLQLLRILGSRRWVRAHNSEPTTR